MKSLFADTMKTSGDDKIAVLSDYDERGVFVQIALRQGHSRRKPVASAMTCAEANGLIKLLFDAVDAGRKYAIQRRAEKLEADNA